MPIRNRGRATAGVGFLVVAAILSAEAAAAQEASTEVLTSDASTLKLDPALWTGNADGTARADFVPGTARLDELRANLDGKPEAFGLYAAEVAQAPIDVVIQTIRPGELGAATPGPHGTQLVLRISSDDPEQEIDAATVSAGGAVLATLADFERNGPDATWVLPEGFEATAQAGGLAILARRTDGTKVSAAPRLGADDRFAHGIQLVVATSTPGVQDTGRGFLEFFPRG